MVDTRIMFNLAKLSGDKYLSGIVVPKIPSKVGVPFGTPCITEREGWEYKGTSEVRVLFSFAKTSGHTAHESYTVKKRDVIITKDEPFVNNHKIKVVPRFDWSKVEAIQEYVNTNGSLTINISNHGADSGGEITGIVMEKFFDGLLDNLLRKYKYHSIESYSCDESYKATTSTDLNHYITFMSLPNCIPIFNRKRVHGMGIIYTAIKYQHSIVSGMLSYAAQLGVLLTNHLDNKYVIDGIVVGTVNPVSKDTIGRLKKLAMVNARIKTKHKKPSKEEPSSWGSIKNFRYEPITGVAYANTSSATTTYYIDTS